MSGEAELLTRAADKARRLAQAAIAERGQVGIMGGDAIQEHLTSWKPATGLLLADWLEAQAANAAVWDDGVGPSACPCREHAQICAAVAFACGYLGVESPTTSTIDDQEK